MGSRARPLLFVWLMCVLSAAGCASRVEREANLERQGNDTIRVWAYRWPAPVGGPEGNLAGIVAAFKSSHPGTRVEVTTLGHRSSGPAISRAIGIGEPPDLFIPPPGELALYSRSLQVDLGPHLTAQDLGSYLPGSLDACRDDARLMALPRWIEGRAWICNPGPLLKAGIEPGRTSGWTWGQFESDCRALKALGYTPAIIDPSSPETLSALGYKPALAVMSSPPAELVGSLYRQGLADPAILGSPDHGTLDSFLRGRVGFAIGMNHALLGEVLRMRFTNGGSAPLLVPVPSSGVPGSPLRAGGIIVFRQVRYRGDDHTRLAVEFAKMISVAPPEPGLSPLLVPAYRPNLGDWTAFHRWNAVVALASVNNGTIQRLRTDADIHDALDIGAKARRELKKGFSRP